MTRGRLAVVLAAAALLIGGGSSAALAARADAAGAGASTAVTATTPTATASTMVAGPTVPGALVPIPAAGPRGWYADPNGIPHLLPKGPHAVPGQHGDYPAMWFRGDTLDPQPAPVVAGEPSPVIVRHFRLALTSTSAPSQVIRLTGLPAKPLYEVRGDNRADAPDGVSVDIAPATPDGLLKTERAFTVTQAGLKTGTAFTLDVWVLAVAP